MHVDHLVELRPGHLAHRRIAGDAGVVDHHVEGSESVDRSGQQRRDVVGDGDVAAQAERNVGADLGGGVSNSFGIQVAERNGGTLRGETFGDGQSDALGRSGDDGGLAVE